MIEICRLFGVLAWLVIDHFLCFICLGVDLGDEFLGGVEQVLGRVFDFFAVLFLGGAEGGGEKLGAEVNDSSNAGFEFEAMPEEGVGFVNGKILIELEVIQILAANKPS